MSGSRVVDPLSDLLMTEWLCGSWRQCRWWSLPKLDDSKRQRARIEPPNLILLAQVYATNNNKQNPVVSFKFFKNLLNHKMKQLRFETRYWASQRSKFNSGKSFFVDRLNANQRSADAIPYRSKLNERESSSLELLIQLLKKIPQVSKTRTLNILWKQLNQWFRDKEASGNLGLPLDLMIHVWPATLFQD